MCKASEFCNEAGWQRSVNGYVDPSVVVKEKLRGTSTRAR